MLASPREGAEKKIMSDASDYGLGSVLLQREDEQWRPIGFASRKLKGAEMNYTTTEKECMAVVYGLKKFKHYLQGGPEFEVVTDHHALKWLLSLKDPRGRLARLMMEIQDFDFKVVYAPGKELVVPDILSRDSFQATLCTRCNKELEKVEAVNTIDEDSTLPTRDELLAAQQAEFGNFDDYVNKGKVKGGNYVVNDEGLLSIIHGSNLRILMPNSSINKVLKRHRDLAVKGR